MYDQIICSFTICLSYSKILLWFLFSLICSWLTVTNSSRQLLTIPSVYCYLCPLFLKSNRAFYINFDFCFEKRLFLKYIKNNFKIFWKYCNSSVYFENIVVCNEPLTLNKSIIRLKVFFKYFTCELFYKIFWDIFRTVDSIANKPYWMF